MLTPLGEVNLLHIVSTIFHRCTAAATALSLIEKCVMTVNCCKGREQAELTGQRLGALGLKYDLLIHSSMARATETANIISKYLPGLETQCYVYSNYH